MLHAVWTAGAMLGWVTVGLAAVRARCLLVGHDDGFAREPKRLFLRCAACGRRTTGWAISTSAPRASSRLRGQTAPMPAARADVFPHPARALQLVRENRDKAG